VSHTLNLTDGLHVLVQLTQCTREMDGQRSQIWCAGQARHDSGLQPDIAVGLLYHGGSYLQSIPRGLVCSSYNDKILKNTDKILKKTTEIHFLTVLGAEVQDQGVSRSGFSTWLIDDCLHAMSSCGFFAVCGFSSCKDISSIGLGS
jgi:hypothetical protein